MDTRLLGRIPLDEATRQAGDSGRPAALEPDSASGAIFREIAASILTAHGCEPTGELAGDTAGAPVTRD